MHREVLYAKIHRAVVTECDPDYVGSITLDPILLDATGMLPNEKVLIADVTGGNRFETYILEGERGSGACKINGAAARLTSVGNVVLVLSFCWLEASELASHRPRVAICAPDNSVDDILEYEPSVR